MEARRSEGPRDGHGGRIWMQHVDTRADAQTCMCKRALDEPRRRRATSRCWIPKVGI